MRGITVLVVAALASALCQDAPAQPTDEITYQGELLQDGQALNDPADFVFRLYDASTGGALIGTPVAIDNRNL